MHKLPPIEVLASDSSYWGVSTEELDLSPTSVGSNGRSLFHGQNWADEVLENAAGVLGVDYGISGVNFPDLLLDHHFAESLGFFTGTNQHMHFQVIIDKLVKIVSPILAHEKISTGCSLNSVLEGFLLRPGISSVSVAASRLSVLANIFRAVLQGKFRFMMSRSVKSLSKSAGLWYYLASKHSPTITSENIIYIRTSFDPSCDPPGPPRPPDAPPALLSAPLPNLSTLHRMPAHWGGDQPPVLHLDVDKFGGCLYTTEAAGPDLSASTRSLLTDDIDVVSDELTCNEIMFCERPELLLLPLLCRSPLTQCEGVSVIGTLRYSAYKDTQWELATFLDQEIHAAPPAHYMVNGHPLHTRHSLLALTAPTDLNGMRGRGVRSAVPASATAHAAKVAAAVLPLTSHTGVTSAHQTLGPAPTPPLGIDTMVAWSASVCTMGFGIHTGGDLALRCLQFILGIWMANRRRSQVLQRLSVRVCSKMDLHHVRTLMPVLAEFAQPSGWFGREGLTPWTVLAQYWEPAFARARNAGRNTKHFADYFFNELAAECQARGGK